MFTHDILIKNCTLIRLMTMPMHRFLEALEDKEVDLSRYNLFILVLGCNDLELDRLFFDLYYKRVIDSLQRQSSFVKFLISTLVTNIALFTSAIHSKNVVIKNIKEMNDRISLFNVWKKFQVLNMIQPEFVRPNKLIPMEAKLLIKFMGHKISGEKELCLKKNALCLKIGVNRVCPKCHRHTFKTCYVLIC